LNQSINQRKPNEKHKRENNNQRSNANNNHSDNVRSALSVGCRNEMKRNECVCAGGDINAYWFGFTVNRSKNEIWGLKDTARAVCCTVK